MYLFMFIITFIMSLKTSWTYNNFTYLSYQPNLRLYFLIWITMMALFLLFKVIKLFNQITYMTSANKILIGSSFISMLIGAYLPYHPDNENIISVLHVLISTIGTISLLVIIQILINRIMLLDHDFYKQINMLFQGQILLLGMLIIMFGTINSIVELFFTFITLFSLARIEKYFNQ